jgi:hypothetical protein
MANKLLRIAVLLLVTSLFMPANTTSPAHLSEEPFFVGEAKLMITAGAL